jgi:hypothetical protein
MAQDMSQDMERPRSLSLTVNSVYLPCNKSDQRDWTFAVDQTVVSADYLCYYYGPFNTLTIRMGHMIIHDYFSQTNWSTL